MEEKRYKIIMSKRMAVTLEFLFGLKYYIHDNKIDSTKKVYSFEDTSELHRALNIVMDIRNNSL